MSDATELEQIPLKVETCQIIAGIEGKNVFAITRWCRSGDAHLVVTPSATRRPELSISQLFSRFGIEAETILAPA